MSFRQFLLILKARWLVMLITFSIVVGSTIIGVMLWPKKYSATATVVVDFKGADPVLGMLQVAEPSKMGTQVDIIQSHKVAASAVRQLKLGDSPQAREQFQSDAGGRGNINDWLADLLSPNIDVQPGRESNLIDISFKGSDPNFAALLANALVDAYVATNLELRVDPAKQTSTWFDEQIKTLKSQLEEAQGALNDYQREKGLVATDDRTDVEMAKLSELSAQLSQSQGAVADGVSRQKQLQDFVAKGQDPGSLPDILANGMIQNLKLALAQSQARLEQLSSTLGVNHPEVQRLKADIAAQRSRLKEEIATVSTAIGNSLNISRRREAELRAQVADQKAKLFRFNQNRDQLAVLINNVQSAQKALDTASQRFTTTNLESQVTQTNISVLNRAIPPLYPSSPRSKIAVAASAAVGGFFALALALLFELVDRRVRSEADLLAYFDYPLLGVLDKARSTKRLGSLRILPFKRQVQPAAG